MNARRIFFGVVLLVSLSSIGGWRHVLAGEKEWNKETQAETDVRMKWWRDARFGMFIHWGLYAVPAGTWNGQRVDGIGEWIMDRANIPVEDYEKLAGKFNPVKFDAAEWVRIAKDAGMKYMVITSKHHDGFCLFDSDATDYNVVDASPYGKDLLQSLAAECRKQGLKFCTYYSIMDWHHPAQYRGSDKRYNPTKVHPERKAEYLDFMKKQLKELLDTCDTEVLWFDGEWPAWWLEEDGREIYAYLRELKPALIVNNRIGKGRKGMEGLNKGDQDYVGDFGTPEQQIPATGLPGVDWESCMTMNRTWGYKSFDNDWKSSETLIRNIIDIASKGGNYLLNVGPTAEGLIPGPSVERLGEIGRWMKANGESVYATEASPFKRLVWGRCTTKACEDGATLYLHVFDWPADGQLLVPGLRNKPEQAYLLADDAKKALAVQASDQGVVVAVPAEAPDPICTVVVLKVKGPLKVEPTLPSQQADGTIKLRAADAICHGHQIRYEAGHQRDNVGFWLDPNDWVEWTFRITQPGKFTVSAETAATGSGSFELIVGDQTIGATAPTTGDYSRFTTLELGQIEIAQTGKACLAVKAVKEGWKPFNLKSITFKPAGAREK
ncbi:MAG: alpha-L-fucosidase [Planctomycetes bacterium]|nr:alpha-L-fucosidase [Planctomycetota bacterium]MBL7040347.1 alpha-L-fucosidase [Pirellulaceae bacterium]